MKEFIILQFKLYKEGKSSIPIESLDIIGKKFLEPEEYAGLLNLLKIY